MTKRIVVIDDEEDVLRIIRAALITRGYAVELAPGGAEGLAAIERERPDLIICDLMMPRVSGLEVLKRLKRMPTAQGVPIVILSALGTDDRPPEFWVKMLGVDDFVQKPFDPLDLLGRVEYLFRRGGYVSARGMGTGTPTNHAPAAPPAVPPIRLPESESARPLRTAPTEDQVATRSPIEVGEVAPSVVVKIFVEAWNRQDFATEFQCLGEEMLGGLDLRAYVERRRQTYLDEKAQARQQRVLGVEEEKISLNVAKVVIDREDTIAGAAKSRKETYSLKKTYKGWKIVAVRMVKKFPNPAPPTEPGDMAAR